ncbi:hypothetical protein DVH24_038227, partial [Malus domestica]
SSNSNIVTFRPGPPSHPELDSTVTRYCLFWAPTTLSRFCIWELTIELPNGSPIMRLLSPESEASKLLKSLVLCKDENIHIRLRKYTPLSDVGCNKHFISLSHFNPEARTESGLELNPRAHDLCSNLEVFLRNSAIHGQESACMIGRVLVQIQLGKHFPSFSGETRDLLSRSPANSGHGWEPKWYMLNPCLSSFISTIRILCLVEN